jgi:cell division septation protein DedD
MPTYTPVTRGLDQRQPAPEPPQPAYAPYTPPQPAAPAQPSYTSPQSPVSLNYQSPNLAAPSYPAAAPSYQSPHPAAAPSYQNSYPAAAPNYPHHQPAAAPSYQAADLQTQAYRGGNQQVHAGPQSYPASSAQGFPSQPYGSQNFSDASFQDPNAGDASFPETSFADQNLADPNFANQSFGNQSLADESFSEQGFDASFSDASFPSSSPFTHQEQPGLDDGYAQPQAPADQGFDTFTEEAAQDYVMASQSGQVPASDPRRQLQAFDALYDQPPQIPLGSTDQSRRPAQDFYEGERADADFLDEGQVLPPPGARSKMAMTIRGRSAFMVGSALLGAIALGGALAFAYKQSGGGLSEQPPLVTADSRPVKELPDQPGGKDFAHKNKLIYDRLQNGDEPDADHLVPRQENVAVPALPASTETAGMPTPVASTDLATTQAVDQAASGAPTAVASVDDAAAADGGPRRVKTMVVRPDGSVQAPPMPPEGAATPAVADAPADMQLAAAGPPPAQAAAAAPPAVEAPPAPVAKPAAPQQVAALQPAPVKPKPAKPAVQTAAATPAAATAPTKYVVQVGSKKNQTEALASFADMQQKYPTLLANYRPMVQKADLGAKGTWYRLRIGPISDKTAAAKLCSQLKSQGMPDCLVTSQ